MWNVGSGKMTTPKDNLTMFLLQSEFSGKFQHAGCVCVSVLCVWTGAARADEQDPIRPMQGRLVLYPDQKAEIFLQLIKAGMSCFRELQCT